MQSKFFLLLAMCALATALPLDKRSVESHSQSESDESAEVVSSTTTTLLPSKIITIRDAADLENRITQAGESSDNVVIIYLMTTWCPYCEKVNPKIEDIAAKTKNLIVLKVDGDQVREDKTIWMYGLKSCGVPTFIFIKDGEKVKQISGSDADIRGTLTKIMSPTNNSNSSDSSDE